MRFISFESENNYFCHNYTVGSKYILTNSDCLVAQKKNQCELTAVDFLNCAFWLMIIWIRFDGNVPLLQNTFTTPYASLMEKESS